MDEQIIDALRAFATLSPYKPPKGMNDAAWNALLRLGLYALNGVPAAPRPAVHAEPVAQVAEDFVFMLRKQPTGERWPVGTKLYARPVDAWAPAFDATSHEQEQLAIEFCAEIAGPLGQPGRKPDPVRLLEMAEALYQAELRSNTK